MKSIVYIVPYFGAFPEFFNIWLHSCKNNPTIDWLIFTDDRRNFNYPPNVKVRYTTLDWVEHLGNEKLGFHFNLKKPYKLCDLKIAYGLIFSDFINKYDFWGFCDIDLIFGDIRKFYTDDILNTYNKIGYQGHSTLVRNTDYYNRIFLTDFDSYNYKSLLNSPNNEFTDEEFFNVLFSKHLKEPFYNETTFANLNSLVFNFHITYLPSNENKKNKRFIFLYEKGKLYRLSVVKNSIYKDEFMYVHFLKREMSIKIPYNSDAYLIIPNKLVPIREITPHFIKIASKPHWFKFMISHFVKNAHKINRRSLIPILKTKIHGYLHLLKE